MSPLTRPFTTPASGRRHLATRWLPAALVATLVTTALLHQGPPPPRSTSVDRRGASQPLRDNAGWWVVDLPAATAHFRLSDDIRDPDAYHYIGGDPLLVIEEGTDARTAVAPPELGDPGGAPQAMSVSVNPAGGQSVNQGQYLTVSASGGGLSQSFDLAPVVN